MGDTIFLFIARLSEDGVIEQCNAGIPRVVFNDFVQIFYLNEKGELPQIQCADTDFNDRLKKKGQVFKEQNKTTRGFFKFLESIPTNQYFLVYSDFNDIVVELSDIMKIANNLCELNNIDAMFHANEQLDSNYFVKGYRQSAKKIFIGSKTNRKCRFCGKSSPEVSFKNDAHAVSNSLGNNTIFSYEECDVCNEKFGETIEMEFYNVFAPIYSIHAIRGKNGTRKYKGDSIEIDPEKISVISPSQSPTIEELEESGFLLNCKGATYIPQNLYKCLCKFAIGVIDAKYLPELSNTIQWINSPDMLSVTPSILLRNVFSENHPQIGVYINKNYCDTKIRFIFRLFLLGLEYVYTMPFDAEGNIISSDDHMQEFLLMFWRDNKAIVNEYKTINYSSSSEKVVEIPLNIKPASRENFVFPKKDTVL